MKLQKLKLTQLNNVALRQDEMEHLIGAESCGCGCHGPSGLLENGNANYFAGYSTSIGGDNKICAEQGEPNWRVNHNSSELYRE